MRTVRTMFCLAAALLPLSGCVVVVGNDLESDGHQWTDGAEHPRMGVYMGSVSDALASQLNVHPSDATLIVGIIGGSPAERAGVKIHDVVAQVNGSDHASPDDLRRVIRDSKDGEEIRLHIIRAGQPMDLTVLMDGTRPSGPNE